MTHRGIVSQAVCDEGLRRIAEAANQAGLPELATEAEEDTEGLWRAVRLARSGPYE